MCCLDSQPIGVATVAVDTCQGIPAVVNLLDSAVAFDEQTAFEPWCDDDFGFLVAASGRQPQQGPKNESRPKAAHREVRS